MLDRDHFVGVSFRGARESRTVRAQNPSDVDRADKNEPSLFDMECSLPLALKGPFCSLPGGPELVANKARTRSRSPTLIAIMLVSAVFGFLLLRFAMDKSDNAPSAMEAITTGIDPESGYPKKWLEHNSKTELKRSAKVAKQYQKEVVEMMKFAWGNYRKLAFGQDHLDPVSGKVGNVWVDSAITLIDALSTLWLMDMKEEFAEAREFVRTMKFKGNGLQSFFETEIRVLGGLLGAHSLSKDPVFLERAREVGDLLLNVFSDDHVFPASLVDLGTGETSADHQGIKQIAEVASSQVEFQYLSHHTGDPRYAEKAQRVTDALLQLHRENEVHGLIPTEVMEDPRHPGKVIAASNAYSTAGGADSYYEYLLKQYLLTNGKPSSEPGLLKNDQSSDETVVNAWIDSVKDVIQYLLHHAPKDDLLYVDEVFSGEPAKRMPHLGCYLPANIMLGSQLLPLHGFDVPSKHWERLAGALTETCYAMYDTESGLAPETADFSTGKMSFDLNSEYVLRPEALEALYHMWYFTGEDKWRKMARDIMEALNSSARTKFGFSSVQDVDEDPLKLTDKTESFFYAETLKYLYLIFSDRTKLDLSEYVLNTEAHPLQKW